MENDRRSHAVQMHWQQYYGLRRISGRRASWFDNAAYLAGESLQEEPPLISPGLRVAE
jgi:hypothetical protein